MMEELNSLSLSFSIKQVCVKYLFILAYRRLVYSYSLICLNRLDLMEYVSIPKAY